MSTGFKWLFRVFERKGQKPARHTPSSNADTDSPLMQLQSVLGNRGTSALLQAKSASGRATDPLELQADSIAEAIVKPAGSGSTESGGNAGSADAPIPTLSRSFYEQGLGADLSGVRLHNDSRSGRAVQSLGAHAVTMGSDIYFGPGQLRPESAQGQRLLAHELVHVVQQRKGNAPLLQCDECDFPIEIAPADREPGTVISEESLSRIQSFLLEMGVREDEIGDLTTLSRFSDCQINSGLQLLETLAAGGPGRGGEGRVVRAWNRALDDLGAQREGGGGGRRSYPTIIHFALNLDRLAEESMGMPYLQAIRAMPAVTLAGATFPVHPRAVYFVAAAQVGMDIEGGMRPGEGHYIAPGAFGEELSRLQAEARQIARQPAGRRERLNAIRRRLQYMHQIMLAQQQDMELPERGYHPTEHREPALVQWFSERSEAIRDLQDVTSDEQTQTSARAMLAILDQTPRRGEIHHGFGSVDPHGTEHALGLAVDLFNGRGRAGWFANMGIRREYWPFIYELMDLHGGEVGLGGLRPTAIHQLPAAQARSLSLLLQSEHSVNLRDELLALPIPEPARGEAAAEEQRRGHEYRAMVDASRQALWQAVRRLNVLRRERHFRGQTEFRRDVFRLHEGMRTEADSLAMYSPEQIQDLLERRAAEIDDLVARGTDLLNQAQAAESPHDQQFGELQRELAHREFRVRRVRHERQLERRRLQSFRMLHESTRRATPPDVREEFGQWLQERTARAREQFRERESTAMEQLQAAQQALRRHGRLSAEARRLDADRSALLALREESGRIPSVSAAAAQFDELPAELAQHQAIEHNRALRGIVERPAFQTWLDMVRERAIFDQPRVMLEGLNRVMAHEAGGAVSTHFYGGHHWEIAPTSVLEGAANYREALQRDINSRSVEELLAIVYILEEWPGGRSALQNDPTLRELLNEALLREAGLSLAAISESAALAEAR